MINNDQIRDFIKKNPSYSNSEIAKHFKVTYDRVQAISKRLKRKELEQPVETPEGYKGTLTKGKMWQLHDGSWRESLTFEVDQLERWNNFKAEFIEDIKALAPIEYTVLTKANSESKVCLEISLPDLHFGKGDIDDISNTFINCVFQLLEKAEKFGIEKILLPLGNDGMNSEGRSKATTAGTPQDDSVHWQDSFRHYCATMMATVQMLSKSYPVEIIIVPGNHDTERMFYAGEVLQAYFMNNPRVLINNSGEYRKYYEYGKNMLLFTHGDKEKTSNLPLIMATEQPEMFARTKYREAHLGHFHKEMLNEYNGIKTRFIPSICTTDEWHKMMGYQQLRVAQAFMWNKNSGLEGFFQINLHED